jgi:DNA invertase Pin-like site-specific DNA recombinase
MRTVAYYRVSTAAQGRSGLGLEAQRAAVSRFCQGRSCEMLGEYVEVESGKLNDRPELAKALHHAKVTGATLVVAKMDRLSRNAAFLLTLRDSGAKLVAADNPDVNELTVGILAVIAEDERKRISERTSAALQAAKGMGVRLGNPNGAAALKRAGQGNTAALAAIRYRADRHASDIAPIISHLRAEGRQVVPYVGEKSIGAPRRRSNDGLGLFSGAKSSANRGGVSEVP